MNEKSLQLFLKENPFVLAPMASITDNAFRSFMKKMSAGVMYSELISATGVLYGSEKTLRLMDYEETQRPFGVQLFGDQEEHLSHAAKVAESKGVDFIDLNVGCPVPKVTKKGAGSALLKDLAHLKNLIKGIKKNVDIPLSIKIRTGWDEQSKNADEVLKIAQEEGVMWVCIHGRTRSQNYKGKSDWDYIKKVKAQFENVHIIGNGDISSSEMAVNCLNQSGCEGVMVGRGALKNPWIFRESLHRMKRQSEDSLKESNCTERYYTERNYTESNYTDSNYTDRHFDGKSKSKESHYKERNYEELFHLLVESHNPFCEERILLQQIKKLVVWMSTGYAGSSQFRKNIFSATHLTELEEHYKLFFSQMKEEKSEIDFLMGGHG